MSFGLTEILLRVAYEDNPKVKYFLYSPKYDLNLDKIKTTKDLGKYAPCAIQSNIKINGFLTNPNGFWTNDYSLKKAEGITRIGFIGDSFLIGVVPYEKNFVTLIGNNLKQTEVINWGMPCLGPQYEEKIVEIESIKSHPDFLVWTFFVGNDFTDELTVGQKLPVANLITKNIFTLRLIRNLQKGLMGLNIDRHVVQNNQKYDDSRPTFTNEQYLKIEGEKIPLFVKDQFPYSSLENIKQTLLTFNNNCLANSIKCLVVIAPDEIQVNKDLLSQVTKVRKIDPASININLPQSLLTQFLGQNNISYLDLLPAFDKMTEVQKLYQPADTHWNIAGNQLAADEIIKYILGTK